MVKKNRKLILLILFVVGLLLRTTGTLKGYFAFTYDQGRDFLTLSQLVNKNFTLIGPPTGINGVFHGVWWFYFLLPLFYISRGDPQIVLLLFSILASFNIILAYFLGKQIKDNQLGLILAGITTLSPYFVSTAAQLWHPNMLPMLILLFYLIYVTRLSSKVKWGLLGFILGAIFEFEFASGGLMVLAIFATTLLMRIKFTFKSVLVGGAGFCFWLIPRIIFELRHHFIQTTSLFNFLTSYFTLDRNRLKSEVIINRLLLRFKTYFGVFKHFMGMDQNWLAWVFLTMIGLFFLYRYKLRSKIPKSVKFSLLSTVVILFLALFYPDNLWDYYLISLSPLFLVFMGWVVYEFFQIKRWVVYLLLFLIAILTFWPFLIKTDVWEGDASVYKNQTAVVRLIYKDAHQKPFNLEIFSPSLIAYNYQYLFGWMGEREFGYTPESQAVLTDVYYILEPDPWGRGLREKWLEDRVHNEKMIWQTNMPGEIEVQKRLRELNWKK